MVLAPEDLDEIITPPKVLKIWIAEGDAENWYLPAAEIARERGWSVSNVLRDLIRQGLALEQKRRRILAREDIIEELAGPDEPPPDEPPDDPYGPYGS